MLTHREQSSLLSMILPIIDLNALCMGGAMMRSSSEHATRGVRAAAGVDGWSVVAVVEEAERGAETKQEVESRGNEVEKVAIRVAPSVGLWSQREAGH